MNKYFEIVSISEKPEKDGWYYVMNPNREILPRMIEYKVGSFHNHNKVLASYYLKPIESLPIDRDAAEKIWEDAWKRKQQEERWRMLNEMPTIEATVPSKKEYLKQFE